jgi:hypothetical protein
MNQSPNGLRLFTVTSLQEWRRAYNKQLSRKAAYKLDDMMLASIDPHSIAKRKMNYPLGTKVVVKVISSCVESICRDRGFAPEERRTVARNYSVLANVVLLLASQFVCNGKRIMAKHVTMAMESMIMFRRMFSEPILPADDGTASGEDSESSPKRRKVRSNEQNLNLLHE